jgi:hypothetical protein
MTGASTAVAGLGFAPCPHSAPPGLSLNTPRSSAVAGKNVTDVALPSGQHLRVPTPAETLRVKGYLVVRRNQTRDYLDVAALADRYGEPYAAAVLAHIDDYYADQRAPEVAGVASQLAVQLVEPRPESWPFEGVLAAVERGALPDWRRLVVAINAEPWGRVARYVTQALEVAQPYGVAPLMRAVVRRARERAERAERLEVVVRLDRMLRRSGLDKQTFAERAGTSASRLSTYLNGKVMPSAALMVRMEKLAERAEAAGPH